MEFRLKPQRCFTNALSYLIEQKCDLGYHVTK
jgi:hypothetical protein